MSLKVISLAVALPLVTGLAAKGCSGDADWDGLTDDVDNCVEVYNPAQADEDGDATGDACDAATPDHGLVVDGCFSSDWPPLRGVNWEDRPTYIQQGDVDASQIYVEIDWTASDSQWIETGDGSTNGQGIWFDIRDEHNPYLYTRTIVEGTGTDTDNDGRVDEISGTYIMLKCEGEDATYCMTNGYELWTDGDWVATRINSLECNF